jgi:hypothetical protein
LYEQIVGRGFGGQGKAKNCEEKKHCGSDLAVAKVKDNRASPAKSVI